MLFWGESWIPARGIVEHQGPVHNESAQPAGASDFVGPGDRTDPKCGCRLEVLRLIAAAADARDAAQTGQAAQPSEAPQGELAQKVRSAGELLAAGDAARAKEIVREALRECESGHGNLPDCAYWLKALQGLDSLIDKPREKIVLTNSIGMRMVRIPASEYMMGSPKGEMDWLRLKFKKVWREGHKQWFQDELPLHPVRITHPFYMAATELTVGQFRQFVKETGYKTDAEKGDGGMIWSKSEARWVPKKDMKWDSVPWQIADNQPVVFVSWNDAQAFCKWLSNKEKRTYRLPTEAEWEMACRGGKVWVRYPWGDRMPGDHDTNFGDGDPKLPESLTTVNDGYRYVAPVGSFPPNGFSLYDMSGNVMEWVGDHYERNYYQDSPLEDPKGPNVGSSRVNKGGNWLSSPADDRCAFRGFSGETMSFWNLGFRVVLEEEKTLPASRTAQPEDTEAVPTGNANLPPSEEQGLRMFRQAVFAAQQERWDDAVKDLEEALKVYEQRQDHQWVARVKATLAGIYAERNRIYKSKELYTQALAGFRKIGDAGSARILLARLRELETSPGVKVVDVKKGSIADKAGVVNGDVIIEYGGETGFRVSGFKKLVSEYMHADTVTLSVVNNEEISTMVVPGGLLGVAIEDMKRPPRVRRAPERERPRDRDRRRPPRQPQRDRNRR
jgi:formylglycine-generating enzyme